MTAKAAHPDRDQGARSPTRLGPSSLRSLAKTLEHECRRCEPPVQPHGPPRASVSGARLQLDHDLRPVNASAATTIAA